MLAYATPCVYPLSAGAKSSAGFGDSNFKRRTSAHRDTGVFFMPANRVYGGCAWETERSAGFRLSRFANLRTATPKHCLATVGDGSISNGAPSMNHIDTLLLRSMRNRAEAHKSMARAALVSTSSASVRQSRFNDHMKKASAIEADIAEAEKEFSQ